MNRLIIETSTRQASLAFFAGSELLAEEIFPGGRGPVSPLFSTLQRMLEDAPPLDEIIVGVGPGSYSGIRIGISAAIGLQLAWKIPARGIHSAMGYEGSDFQVILDARGSWVVSTIRDGKLTSAPTHHTREQWLEKKDDDLPIFTPDNVLDLTPTFPRAAVIGKRLLDSKISANLRLQPLYLKPPHITMAKDQVKTSRPNTPRALVD